MEQSLRPETRTASHHGPGLFILTKRGPELIVWNVKKNDKIRRSFLGATIQKLQSVLPVLDVKDGSRRAQIIKPDSKKPWIDVKDDDRLESSKPEDSNEE